MNDENTNQPPEEKKSEPLRPACPLKVEDVDTILASINAGYRLGGIEHMPVEAHALAHKLARWQKACKKDENGDG